MSTTVGVSELKGFFEADWSAFRVTQNNIPKPKTAHFAGVLVGERWQTCEAYDGYGETNVKISDIWYYAFAEKSDLEKWISQCIVSQKKFFFFRVDEVGEVSINVDVKVK